MALEEGSKPPSFRLCNQDGEKVSLLDFKNKDVVLYFYPKDNTPGCTKEACGFRDLWKKYQKKNIVVLGVSPDPVEKHAEFQQEYGLPFMLLSDPDKSVMTAYGAYGEKVLYGKKTMGVIRSTVWIGRDGTVKRHWKRVPKAETHPEQVLAYIEETMEA
jgi:peroxiredoxin Q/BCP